MRVIDNYTTTNGVKLTAVADNPVTITGSCEISIDKTLGSAVAGESYGGQPNYNFPWYIKNFGLLSATGSGSAGVGLFGGGTVVNEGGISGAAQGIYAGYQPATVINFGFISASGKGGRGILLADGGKVVNDRYITGYVGGIKIIDGNATVANYGRITNLAGTYGVKLYGSLGNLLINGPSGVIQNEVIAKGSRTTLINDGTISGSVGFSYGGLIRNGSSGSTAAVINGFYTIIKGVAGAGTVVNYGSMSGYFVGVDLVGGSFSNAQPGATVASKGVEPNTLFIGVLITGGAAGTVTNLGTVEAADSSGTGVNLGSAGGTVTNGSAGVATALIEVATPGFGIGIESGAVASVTNYATISAGTGVLLSGGGSVANTGAAALIAANFAGVDLVGSAAGTLTNSGTISASNPNLSTYGVRIGSGDVVNGSSVATAALIVADPPGPNPTPIGASIKSAGVVFATSGSLANYGTVAGARTGVAIAAGSVTNGSAGMRAGSIEGGYYGVHAAGAVTQPVAIANYGTVAAVGTAGIGIDLDDAAGNTVRNFGTISGASGTALAFGAGDDRLVVRPGAVFEGVVEGGGGANEIDFHIGGKIGLAPEFVGFATVRLDPAAAASLSLKPLDLAGLAGNAATVIDGNAGDTVSAAALTAGERASVTGGSGNDVFVGGAGTDLFTGGAGADRFEFAATALAVSDRVAGGSGSDTLVMTSAGNLVAGGVGGVETWRLANGKPSSLRLVPSNFTGTDGNAITVIDGNAGDTVDAAALAASDRVTVTGGGGNDFFVGGPAKDTFIGGAGADTFEFSATALAADDTVLGGSGADALAMMSAGTLAAAGVSGIETWRLGTGGADRLTLTPGNFAGVTAATIAIMGGNDGNTIDAQQEGAGDHAVMTGGAGKDVFTGGPGNDIFRFSAASLSASDVVKGGGGNDTLLLTSAGTASAGGVSQVESYRLANGRPDKLTLTIGNFAGVTAATITVDGGNSGNTVDAHLIGASDHAVMVGGAGKDLFIGGPGSDTFRFSVASLSAGDVVKGGGGNDTLLVTSAGAVAAGRVSGIETYRLANSGANALTLTAGNFAGATAATITVFGGNAANTFDANLAGANDRTVMVGGAGKDVFIGGLGA
ncbi:MAG TPA: calcium-binding protein, partial [Stellaceae bacterium]